MTKIKRAIESLRDSLTVVHRPLLARARRRTKADHERAEKAERQRDHARRNADRLRADGRLRAARRVDKKAARLDARALKFHRKAAHWAERVKLLYKRIEGIEERIDDLEAELKRLQAKGHVFFVDNKARGEASDGRKWLATWAAMCLNCATGTRRNFYSQAGGPDIWHEIEPGPQYGCRSDCSSSITGSSWTCDLDDPNGLNYSGQGYTGTLIGAHGRWRETSLEGLRKKGWGYVVYGSGTGFHTEAFTPSETEPDQTSGHGDAAVNRGSLFMFGNVPMRYFVHD